MPIKRKIVTKFNQYLSLILLNTKIKEMVVYKKDASEALRFSLHHLMYHHRWSTLEHRRVRTIINSDMLICVQLESISIFKLNCKMDNFLKKTLHCITFFTPFHVGLHNLINVNIRKVAIFFWSKDDFKNNKKLYSIKNDMKIGLLCYLTFSYIQEMM
ncbi:hypothetical protein BpHYR1_017418 [Brachionus plicatilis]|uniref:Uncharacterized protein n=1 Tax=Brachionus plicatilis TaxID=10195 RepID=A0A3M7QHF2_BRAPC|nr:hypothetical protein BpHYR1_017418 [Brachionus plicatilis]